MALFQQSVVNEYISQLDEEELRPTFDKFCEYFHNKDIQFNIRNSKEEQFQEGFLIELFVNILGYVINPNTDYNLTTEYKNEKGRKKADGAILTKDGAIAVIELKGTDTTDLDKVTTQAFNYKNHHPICKYVITSNFEKLRFYVDNAVEFEEFNLFNLSFGEFKMMWTCLSSNCLLNDLPQQLKTQSLIVEEQVTKRLYSSYAEFKNDLWSNLKERNTEEDVLLLYIKAQKLIDRFLFILFSEDTGILPPNSIGRIDERWQLLKDEDAYKPIYQIFKQYFGYINVGREGKTRSDDIFAYNGGLFLYDEVLERVEIDDECLRPHLLNLTQFDFASEVDVNILGHIFENSLNDIEEVRAALEGKELDRKSTKRKKDGIYYTPRYVTKFIVDKTIGQLCAKQRERFEIVESEYIKGSRNRPKKTIAALKEKLENYKEWLLDLKICDPSCGSGAFLNQALRKLIDEHNYISELESKLFESGFVFSDVADHILENNIYGVDLNEESVEIAKLSLWLRTAEKGRKLTTLSENIKCGNSLVDDEDIAGSKSFDWHREFSNVFEQGGFDIVIGNPPWGSDVTDIELQFVKQQNEDIVVRMTDSFMFFVNKSFEILSEGGRLGLIVPDVFLYQKDNELLRRKMFERMSVSHAINLGDGVFEDVARASCIVIAETRVGKAGKTCVGNFDRRVNGDLDSIELEEVEQSMFSDIPYAIIPTQDIIGYGLLKKLEHAQRLNDVVDADGIQRGVSPDLKKAFIVNSEIVGAHNLEKKFIRKTVTGGVDVKKFRIVNRDQSIIYTTRNDERDSVPNIASYIEQFSDEITCKEVAQGKHAVYALHRARSKEIFDKESKVVGVITGDAIITAVDYEQLYPTDGLYVLSANTDLLSNESLSAILNSKLLTYLYRLLSTEINRAMSQVKPVVLANVPIVAPSNEHNQTLCALYKECASTSTSLADSANDFVRFVVDKYSLESVSRKLANWFLFDANSFIAELKKLKVKLSLKDEAEWKKYFEESQIATRKLLEDFEKSNALLNEAVYELYGLTDEETELVERSI